MKKPKGGASWSAFPPVAQGTHTFRVAVTTPSIAKIRTVASWKRQQYLKKAAHAAAAAAAANEAPTSAEGEEAGAAAESTPAPAAAATPASAAVTAAAVATAMREGAAQNLSLQAPLIGVVVPANKMLSVSNESIYKELQSIDSNFKIVKQEMNSLTTVRASLLWLLKKSTSLETVINASSIEQQQGP